MSVKQYTTVYKAMCTFVTTNLSFESSVLEGMVTKAMGDATTVNKAMEMPLRHRAIGFEAAIRFGFVVSTVVGVERTGDTAAPAFDLDAYNRVVLKTYDIGAQELVWSLLEDDDDESVESADDDESADDVADDVDDEADDDDDN